MPMMILRLAALSIFASRIRKRQRPRPLDIDDYGISGDELIEREGTWGFTPEGIASMKAAIASQNGKTTRW